MKISLYWVPGLTFGMAILLSLMISPRITLATRPPGHATGNSCHEDKSVFPEEIGSLSCDGHDRNDLMEDRDLSAMSGGWESLLKQRRDGAPLCRQFVFGSAKMSSTEQDVLMHVRALDGPVEEEFTGNRAISNSAIGRFVKKAGAPAMGCCHQVEAVFTTSVDISYLMLIRLPQDRENRRTG